MAVSGLVSGPRGRRRPQGRAQPLGDQMLAGAQEGGPQLGRGGEVAEHFRQIQECAGPVSVLAHGVQEPVAQRVGQLPGVGAGALEGVEALAPAGQDEGPVPDAVARGDAIPDDGGEEGRQPVGGVHHLTVQGVAHRLPGEALLQGPAVGLQVDAGDGTERRQRLVAHVAADEPRDVRVLHGLVHHGASGEQAEVAQRLMGGVEQAQLHPLVGGDVLDDARPEVLEGGAPRAEAVLDHPLDEGLGAHGPGVLDAEVLGEVYPGAIGGRGRDAVDHGAGEVDVLVDPGREVGGAAQRIRSPFVVFLCSLRVGYKSF